MIGTLNINSLSGKIEQLKLFTEYLDILVLVETKLDNTFPTEQLLLEGFSRPFRMDRNHAGGGVLCYVRETIPSKQLNKQFF